MKIRLLGLNVRPFIFVIALAVATFFLWPYRLVFSGGGNPGVLGFPPINVFDSTPLMELVAGIVSLSVALSAVFIRVYQKR